MVFNLKNLFLILKISVQYASIVLVLLIAQVGVAIYASLQKEEFKGLVSAHMVEIFNKYGGKDAELTNGLDSAQHEVNFMAL